MKEYNISDLLIWEAINEAIKYYGIEGAEETIKKVYSQHPTLRDNMLKELKRRYNA